MLDRNDFIRLYAIEHNIIKMQTDGLTQADTLIQPQPSGNCMNWVLGHLLENQLTTLSLLGGVPPIDASLLAGYRTNSAPVTAESQGILELPQLLEQLDRVQEALMKKLAEVSQADFEREIEFRERKMSLGWRFFFLHFHFTYHLGQLELLRQMAGKTEKLI